MIQDTSVRTNYDLQEPDYYEIDYEKDGRQYRHIFNRYGRKIQTSTKITDKEIPEAVKEALQTGEYKDWSVLADKELVEREGMTMYQVRVQDKKGKRKHFLYFDAIAAIVQRKKRRKTFIMPSSRILKASRGKNMMINLTTKLV